MYLSAPGGVIPEYSLEKEHYIFKGYSVKAGGEAEYQAGDKIPAGMTELYAVWEACEYTVKYVLDEESGKMKLVKQKVSEKSLPPNVDLLKLIYPHFIEKENYYDRLSDEELEKEKQRLLKELKEKDNAGGKNKKQNKV